MRHYKLCDRCGGPGHNAASACCPFGTQTERLKESLQRAGVLRTSPITRQVEEVVEQQLTSAQRAAVMNRTGGLCWYCGEEATTVDHAIPLSKGGAGKHWNLLPACERCNGLKSDSDIDAFRIYLLAYYSNQQRKQATDPLYRRMQAGTFFGEDLYPVNIQSMRSARSHSLGDKLGPALVQRGRP